MSAPRLLVVDDEADLTEFVVEVAEEMGFVATGLSDPVCFADVYSNRLSVIVLDLFMPGVDGIEILRFLHDNRSPAAVVFMSGKDVSVLHAASRLAQEYAITVLGTLQKPFTAAQLEAVLGRLSDHTVGAPAKPGANPPDQEDFDRALAEDQFFLEFQPQIDLIRNVPVGVEALLRWRHPERGLIPPGIFIPLAEANGTITAITRRVLAIAIDTLSGWARSGVDPRMAVNISPATIIDLDLPETLSTLLSERGLYPEQMVIEITETALMSDPGRFMDVLTRLRMRGFGLSIDDFGTGYASLQQLVRAPFNELKIDQTFVRDMTCDRECRTIARMSMMLAHELNMHVVAEGIESAETVALLRAMGCEEGQGFFFARPMATADLPDWWRARREAAAVGETADCGRSTS